MNYLVMKVAEVFVKDPEWPNESKGVLFLENDRIVVRINKFPDKVLLRRNDVIISLGEIKKWTKKSRKSLYKKIPMLRIRTKKGVYEILFPGEKGSEERDQVMNWLNERLGVEKEKVKSQTKPT